MQGDREVTSSICLGGQDSCVLTVESVPIKGFCVYFFYCWWWKVLISVMEVHSSSSTYPYRLFYKCSWFYLFWTQLVVLISESSKWNKTTQLKLQSYIVHFDSRLLMKFVSLIHPLGAPSPGPNHPAQGGHLLPEDLTWNSCHCAGNYYICFWLCELGT